MKPSASDGSFAHQASCPVVLEMASDADCSEPLGAMRSSSEVERPRASLRMAWKVSWISDHGQGIAAGIPRRWGPRRPRRSSISSLISSTSRVARHDSGTASR